MCPRIHLDQFNLTIIPYHVLNVTAWFVFLAIGRNLTRNEPGQRLRWWWLFLGMVLCYSVGASYLARIIGLGTAGLRPGPFPADGARLGYWGGPLLFLVWTGLSYLAWRISPYPFLDAFAIAWSVAQVFAKAACLAAGCCGGRPTDLPWGVVFVAREDLFRRHPTQLYEMILHSLTATALIVLFARGRLRGRLVLVLGCLYGSWSPIVESFEEGSRQPWFGGPLSGSQVICLWAFAFCASALAMDATGTTRSTARAVECGPTRR